MSSNKSNHIKLPDLSKASESEIDAVMASVVAAKANLATRAQAEEANKLAAAKVVIESLPSQLTKILGQPVDLKGAFGYFVSHMKGKLTLSLTKPRKVGSKIGDKGKRLTTEQIAAIKADMVKRAIAVKLGQTRATLSEIAHRHTVSTQTVDKYKPNQVELNEALSRLVPAGTPSAPASVESAPVGVSAVA